MADGGWLTAEAPQIKYRIPHQLSWPVKSNIAAAGGELFGRSEHVDSLGIAPKSNDGRMFQQQQHVADLSSLAQINQLPLQPNPFAIINLTELDDRNHVCY